MNILFKGIIDKLFKTTQPTSTSQYQSISQAEVEALVDAKLKEHAAALETTISDKGNQVPIQDEDYTLSAKQIEYALSLIEKVKEEFELAIDPTKLTIKDLNRLIAYNRYKNKGTLINLVKKGVLKKK
ncbi:ABC transporter ATP-binding protein [Neobacillus sp. YX16]|uniref:ABC transporter ATP-binding protein n=1 Tax=Neobacillus sp. YX16 TaxID=3047874 RepID=UPI0024C2A638|nr:ABC transporter ATP-binding protein [Neobacillus sp. YX16]WHZ06036.1 ABC transporter ATP-binding protein [Neobacillus sp. YX16]